MTKDNWIQLSLLVAALAAAVVAFRNLRAVRREREREKLHELELSWFVGDLNGHRLQAERVLAETKPEYSFADLFEKEVHGERIISPADYDSVSAVLRFFYLIDSWAEQGYINKSDAVAVFGRSYVWWYWNHIKDRSRPIEDEPTWHFLVKRHKWLDRGFRDKDEPLYDEMRNPPRPSPTPPQDTTTPAEDEDTAEEAARGQVEQRR